MAKKRTRNAPPPPAEPAGPIEPGVPGLPTDDPPAVAETPAEPPPPDDPPPEPGPVVRAVSIEAPLAADAGGGYLSRHLEVGRLTLGQRTAQRRLLVGLIHAGERLAGGQPVRSNADAWRWVLEQLVAGENGKEGER